MWVYAGLLALVSLIAGTLVLPGWIPDDPWPVAVLLVLTLVLTNMALELPFAVSLTLAFAPVFAGVLLAGPFGGALLGVASAVSLHEIRDRKPLVLVMVNVTQLFLAGLASGWVLVALGGNLREGVSIRRRFLQARCSHPLRQ